MRGDGRRRAIRVGDVGILKERRMIGRQRRFEPHVVVHLDVER
jgi:hypothetical protein